MTIRYRRTTRCPPIPLPAYAVATSGPRVLLTPLPAPILIAVPRTGERDRASWATAPERMARKAGSLSEGEDALAGLILEDVGEKKRRGQPYSSCSLRALHDPMCVLRLYSFNPSLPQKGQGGAPPSPPIPAARNVTFTLSF